MVLLVGGLSSSVAYFIIAIAGFESAWNWMTPIQYITLSGMNGVLAFLGGVRVWAARSEERRVGKECRSGWSPDHYKEKTKETGRRTGETKRQDKARRNKKHQ